MWCRFFLHHSTTSIVVNEVSRERPSRCYKTTKKHCKKKRTIPKVQPFSDVIFFSFLSCLFPFSSPCFTPSYCTAFMKASSILTALVLVCIISASRTVQFDQLVSYPPIITPATTLPPPPNLPPPPPPDYCPIRRTPSIAVGYSARTTELQG